MSDAGAPVPEQQVDLAHLDAAIVTVARAVAEFGAASVQLAKELSDVPESWFSPAARKTTDLQEQLLLRTTALGGRMDELLARLRATRQNYAQTTSTNAAMWTA